FIDGTRDQGLLTQFLPLVEGGIGCSRTRPVQEAIVDLRLLRKHPLAKGARVVGYVRGPEAFRGWLTRPARPAFVAAARIHVTGPVTKTISTDSSGLYELDDLAPGDYTLDLSMPETQTAGFFNH